MNHIIGMLDKEPARLEINQLTYHKVYIRNNKIIMRWSNMVMWINKSKKKEHQIWILNKDRIKRTLLLNWI